MEIDPELSGLAAENIARNGMSGRVRAVSFDVTGAAAEFAAHGMPPGTADRVLMNPPFHDPSRQNESPDPEPNGSPTPRPKARWLYGSMPPRACCTPRAR